MTSRKLPAWVLPGLIPSLAFVAPSLAFAAQDDVLNRGRQEPQARPPAMAPQSARPAPTLQSVVAPDIRLTRILINGAPAPPDVAQAMSPLIGKGLDATTLRAVADGVAGVYGKRAALYTVLLPGQDFKDGVVQLQVIQGYFEGAVIAGKVKDRDMSLIKAYAAKLTAEKPLSKRTLERYVSLIRDIPGLTPDIQLLQGATPGGVRLVIGVKEEKFTWGVGLNNRGSALLDREQAQADFTWNSAFRQGDQTRVTLSASGDWNSAKAAALSHSTPLGKDGARLDLSAAWLQTQVPGGAVKGEASSAGAGISYPVIRGYRDNLYVSFNIDGLNSDNAVLGQTTFSEHTRNLRAAAVFSRARPKSATSLSMVVSKGVDAAGARVNPLIGQVDYAKVAIRGGYDRKLGQTVTLRLRGAAQVSGDALPVSEQFGLGGEAFGRGFANSLLLGDKGAAGSVEAGWTPKAITGRFEGTELYTFADAGAVHANERLALPAGRENLSSAGAGLRLAIKPGYVVGVEAAKPVDAPATVGKDWRYAFSLRSTF
jgi:hemolysin activation/secretion protein